MMTVDELRGLLDYDSETGLLTWRQKVNRKVVIGREAGTLRSDGYRQIRLLGKLYLAHRLAYAHHHGEWPIEVDHINLARSDNRIANLRQATRQQNQANLPRNSLNTSGHKGVSRHHSGKWRVQVKKGGKLFWSGYFVCKNEAATAYAEKSRLAHGDYARVG